MCYGFVQPMSVQELWHWVHVCYGEELGLTSDDEDYVPPSLDESKISSKLASQEFSEVGVFSCLFIYFKDEKQVTLSNQARCTANSFGGK